jgi:tRNA (mo5U34)-methyltransferase
VVRRQDIRDAGAISRLSRAELVDLARQLTWYHTIDFGDGFIVKGAVDIRPHLHLYGFPPLQGKRVLDVGRASGFFAFELERLGADVTAIELPPGIPKNLPGLPDGEPGAARGRLDFFTAHALLRSSVKPVWLDIAAVSPTALGGEFDVVFAGSLLSHLSDPVRGLANLRSVCSGLCVIANPIGRFDHLLSRFVTRRLARLAPSSEATTWWIPNIPCLVEMARRAGFGDVRVMTRNLPLRIRHTKRGQEVEGIVRHCVIHARP